MKKVTLVLAVLGIMFVACNPKPKPVKEDPIPVDTLIADSTTLDTTTADSVTNK